MSERAPKYAEDLAAAIDLADQVGLEHNNGDRIFMSPDERSYVTAYQKKHLGGAVQEVAVGRIHTAPGQEKTSRVVYEGQTSHTVEVDDGQATGNLVGNYNGDRVDVSRTHPDGRHTETKLTGSRAERALDLMKTAAAKHIGEAAVAKAEGQLATYKARIESVE